MQGYMQGFTHSSFRFVSVANIPLGSDLMEFKEKSLWINSRPLAFQ